MGSENSKTDVVVIGGGPAGLMAAGAAAGRGLEVLVLEKNDRPALKLRITGKGRCNLTNDCTIPEFLEAVVSNHRFLYSAGSAFSPADTIRFFESLGVPLKTERGGRVFPVSDRAGDVADALVSYAYAQGVKIQQAGVKSLYETGDGFTLETTKGSISCRAVILATGGVSYPKTGSTGDGYRFARAMGHTIIPPVPSLVPVVCAEVWPTLVQGLSLKNVTLSVIDSKRQGREIYNELGEMLFTHFGVSGPLVLSASAHMRPMESGRYILQIDLKPGLSAEKLDDRILRDFAEMQNRDFANALAKLLPKSLEPVVVELSGISPDKKVNSITREERQHLVSLLKVLPLTATGFRPVEEAIVTAGGVALKEVDPKTMESKLVTGLYFAGEVLDLDAYTGGYNLQIAFCTGRAAGNAVLNISTYFTVSLTGHGK